MKSEHKADLPANTDVTLVTVNVTIPTASTRQNGPGSEPDAPFRQPEDHHSDLKAFDYVTRMQIVNDYMRLLRQLAHEKKGSIVSATTHKDDATRRLVTFAFPQEADFSSKDARVQMFQKAMAEVNEIIEMTSDKIKV